MKTYLMTHKNRPLVYVFDEETTVSYTLADKDILGEYFSMVFSVQQQMCDFICAKMDFAKAGCRAMEEIYKIALCKPGEELLFYLKSWREKYIMKEVGLKVKDGIILSTHYNDEKRVTKEKAYKEIYEMNRVM